MTSDVDRPLTAAGPGAEPDGAESLPYCCPLCKGPLAAEPVDRPERFRCATCARDYPVVLGIPDFRVFPDPYIDYADDHAKAGRLAAEADGLSFARLSERYWAMTPDVTPRLARRFVRHTLGGVERGRASLGVVRRVASELGAPATRRRAFLEVGCGTGGFLVAAAREYHQVVGIDIAFRWLVIARKRVEEAVERGELSPDEAARIRIVCCCAEYLPFPDGRFDLVVGSDVVEHTDQQEQLLRQARRALRPGGLLFLATPNRFSLTPEPHVGVWGVGFLPRRWMRPYVRLVRGVRYDHIRQVSRRELAALLRRAGFARWKVVLPRLSRAELERYSRAERWGAAVYHRLCALPVTSHLLFLFGPFFNAVAVAPDADAGP
jgi:SAM-dependent methyltransferase